MQFKDIISDIEKLIGLKLPSINPTTPSIEILRLDQEKGRYYLRVEGSNREFSRPIKELLTIWNHLSLQGYASVDIALNGGGTSRNQPETVLAHLPYIQHFKFHKRKHLLLRNQPVHPLGELSELSDKEARLVKKQIDNQKAINFSSLSQDQKGVIDQLSKAFTLILTKYSGEVESKEIEKSISKLTNIQETIREATVNVDSNIIVHETSEENKLRHMKLEDLADSPEVTGVDDGENDNDNELQRTAVEIDFPIVESKKSLTTPRIRQLNPTFSLIYDRLRYDEIKIPPYQRKERIWNESEKSKLIESILLGLPLPIFYFAERVNGDWIIVDGLQRITTMLDFINDQIPLIKLEELTEFNNKKFSDLDRVTQRKIREFQLTSYVIDMDTGNSRFISELFHRINTFGVKLSAQEIRNAVNIGNSVTFLNDLANTEEFLRVTNEKINQKRQKDLEVCLSAVAFMIFGYKEYNYNKQDEFLSKAMDFLNGLSSNQLSKIKSRFIDGLLISEAIFGKEAFVKELNPTKSSPISKPLFELTVSVFSCLTESQKIALLDNSDNFVSCFYEAIKSDSDKYASWISDVYASSERGFNYSISQSTGKRVTVLYRFESIINILRETCNIEMQLIKVI